MRLVPYYLIFASPALLCCAKNEKKKKHYYSEKHDGAEISLKKKSKASECRVSLRRGDGPWCTPSEARSVVHKVRRHLYGKVYVYNDTRIEKIHKKVLKNASMVPNNEHLSEIFLHQLLLTSPYYQANASKALYFFVPFYGKLTSHYAKDLMQKLQRITAEMLSHSYYFLRRNGKDHIFVAASSNGYKTFPEFVRKKQLIIFSVDKAKLIDHRKSSYGHYSPRASFKSNIVVSVPYTIDPTSAHTLVDQLEPFFGIDRRSELLSLPSWAPPALGGTRKDRTIQIWFEGGDSSKLRTRLLPRAFAGHHNHKHHNYIIAAKSHVSERLNASHYVEIMLATLQNISISNLCLVPRGQNPATRHFYEAAAFGCIPVIISDNFFLPFDNWLDHDRFAMKITEDCVNATPAAARKALFKVTDTELKEKRHFLAPAFSSFRYDHHALDFIFFDLRFLKDEEKKKRRKQNNHDSLPPLRPYLSRWCSSSR